MKSLSLTERQPEDQLRSSCKTDASDIGSESRVLVLSVHSPHLDRRIVHQMNALAAAGRTVTLVSVPTHVPKEILDPRIEVIAEPFPGPVSAAGSPASPAVQPSTPQWVLRLGRRFPRPIYRAAAWLRWRAIPSAVRLARRAAGFAFRTARRLIAELYRQRQPRTVEPQLLHFFVSKTPRRDYTAIHCHDLPTLPVAASLRQMFFPKSKIIYDSHEFYPYQIPDKAYQRHWKRVEQKWIPEADAVVAVNQSLADFLAQEYRVCPPVVLHNSHAGADTDSPATRKEYLQLFGIEEGGFDVLFQGNLGEDRNLPNLVKAFALLGKDYRLLIIGRGPAEEKLRALAQDMKNVFFGGWVDQSRLLGYTRHAACGVIPIQPETLHLRYCTPNKLYEFLEARLPICASDMPELRRFVEQSGIGAIYDLSRPEQIAAAIRDFRRRVEGGEFPEDRFRQADTLFGWPAQQQRLLDLYGRLAI